MSSCTQDEEDEELVEKAKANRAKTIEAQKATTRAFLKEEGLKDVKLDQELIPVQKAVYKLAQSGSQLAAGEVSAASSTLSEPWVPQFEAACIKIGGSRTGGVVSKLGSLKAAASQGDATASKRAYVELAAELEAWSGASGFSGRLKGLN